MTRTGVTIALVGLLIAGLGAAAYLLVFVAPVDPEWFDRGVLLAWSIGGFLVLGGCVVALVGRFSQPK